MLKLLERLFKSHGAYYTLDYSEMPPPTAEAVAARDRRVAAMKRQMGDKYLLHKPINRERVFPSTTNAARMRRVK